MIAQLLALIVPSDHLHGNARHVTIMHSETDMASVNVQSTMSAITVRSSLVSVGHLVHTVPALDHVTSAKNMLVDNGVHVMLDGVDQIVLFGQESAMNYARAAMDQLTMSVLDVPLTRHLMIQEDVIVLKDGLESKSQTGMIIHSFIITVKTSQ